MATYPSAAEYVDLRSDTVTRPTPEMYAAMQTVAVGDDVLGDDPTVTELEQLAAKLTGKEAAVFVPSGTMGNQIAVACHTQRGEAILIEEEAHILYYEVGGPALFAGVVSWTLPSVNGVMDPNVVESRVLKASIHTPGTTLLCLENTHNRGGGTIVPQSAMQAYRQVADRHGLKVHLDGARVFNAAVAQGIPVSEITQHVDSVNFCLSKGLRSPVGSVLCGSAEFIEAGRIWRKRLGGGMRQSGILAACGIISLTQMVDRLAEDHARAKQLGEAINLLSGVSVDMESVQTNMVMVTTEVPATSIQEKLHAEGIWCFAVAPHRLRLVLHADIHDEHVVRAIEGFRKVCS